MTTPIHIRKLDERGRPVAYHTATGCFDILIGEIDDSCRVRIFIRDGWITVQSNSQLEIHPDAANTIRVRELGAPQ